MARSEDHTAPSLYQHTTQAAPKYEQTCIDPGATTKARLLSQSPLPHREYSSTSISSPESLTRPWPRPLANLVPSPISMYVFYGSLAAYFIWSLHSHLCLFSFLLLCPLRIDPLERRNADVFQNLFTSIHEQAYPPVDLSRKRRISSGHRLPLRPLLAATFPPPPRRASLPPLIALLARSLPHRSVSYRPFVTTLKSAESRRAGLDPPPSGWRNSPQTHPHHSPCPFYNVVIENLLQHLGKPRFHYSLSLSQTEIMY